MHKCWLIITKYARLCACTQGDEGGGLGGTGGTWNTNEESEDYPSSASPTTQQRSFPPTTFAPVTNSIVGLQSASTSSSLPSFLLEKVMDVQYTFYVRVCVCVSVCACEKKRARGRVCIYMYIYICVCM